MDTNHSTKLRIADCVLKFKPHSRGQLRGHIEENVLVTAKSLHMGKGWKERNHLADLLLISEYRPEIINETHEDQKTQLEQRVLPACDQRCESNAYDSTVRLSQQRRDSHSCTGIHGTTWSQCSEIPRAAKGCWDTRVLCKSAVQLATPLNVLVRTCTHVAAQ